MRTWVLRLCAFLCASTAIPVGAGEPASELVTRGNEFYEQGKYQKAEGAYKDAQKLLPESPEINFNLGNVSYRKGDYGAAEEFFYRAAESADATRSLRKKALYNLGNCAFMKGEKLLDSDLQKALDSYKLSILRYQDAVGRDEYDRVRSGGKGFKGDQDAKYNIEVARLRIKDILDKIKQEEEKRKEQQKEEEEFIKKLKEAVEKEEGIVEGTGDARQRKEKGEDVSQAVKELREKQVENKKSTSELAEELQKKVEGAKAQSKGDEQSQVRLDQNVLAAGESLKEAEIEEGTAVQHLEKEALAEAESGEKAALEKLRDALEKLTKPQPPQPQPAGETEQKEEGQESQPEQKQQQPDKDRQRKDEKQKEMTPQEAEEELAKLKKEAAELRKQNLDDFLRRHPEYRQPRREYEPVDKDW